MFFCLLDYCCNTTASLLQINGSAVLLAFIEDNKVDSAKDKRQE